MKSTKYLLFLSILLLVSCKSEPEVAGAGESPDSNNLVITKKQFEHNKMELGEIIERDFPGVIRLSGKVDVPPENRAKINVFEEGYIKRVPVLEGKKVKRGQLILSLENPLYVELQQEYLEMAGKMDFLKSEFERQKIMLDEKITSKKNFLRVESEYKSGLARYNGLRQKLQMLNINPQQVEEGKVISEINIYAPISGTVSMVNASKGMYVKPADNIMEIVNTDHLHLELKAFEKDLMKIEEGQNVRFNLPQTPSTKYDAKIWLVGRSIDEDRMSGIHAHLADSLKSKFAVGMFVEADIITDESLQPALPQDAVIEVDNVHYILVLKEEQENDLIFERKEVKPLASYGGFTAIENAGALQGKQILTSGAYDLLGN